MACIKCAEKDLHIAALGVRIQELREEIESMRETHKIVIAFKDEEIHKLKTLIVRYDDDKETEEDSDYADDLRRAVVGDN